MNVTGLIETDGTVRERYDYDPYGKAYFFDDSWSGVSGSQYHNRILYAGYRHALLVTCPWPAALLQSAANSRNTTAPWTGVPPHLRQACVPDQ